MRRNTKDFHERTRSEEKTSAARPRGRQEEPTVRGTVLVQYRTGTSVGSVNHIFFEFKPSVIVDGNFFEMDGS